MIGSLVFAVVMPEIIFCMIAVPIADLVRQLPHPQVYCTKERAKREITSAHTVILTNGKKVLQGNCKSCGAMFFRMK